MYLAQVAMSKRQVAILWEQDKGSSGDVADEVEKLKDGWDFEKIVLVN